jgi:hypothetical protein
MAIVRLHQIPSVFLHITGAATQQIALHLNGGEDISIARNFRDTFQEFLNIFHDASNPFIH